MKDILKKNLLWIIIGIVIILFIVLSLLIKDGGFKVDPEMQEWYDATQSKEYVVTVISQTTCPNCTAFKPIMDEIKSEYEFNYYLYEADEMSKGAYRTLTKAYTLADYVGTPHTFITYDGKLIAEFSGRTDKETILNFLAENKVIKLNE